MFHKYRIRSLKEFYKNSCSCQFCYIHKKASESFNEKVAGYLLNKKRLQHCCFPVDWAKCFKNTYFEEPLQVAVNNDSN